MLLEEFDLVVVGAGISGIAAANFYLRVHPECRLAILDKDTCPGGVWNARRIYDYFWTQGTVGITEFSNMRMTRPPEEDTYYDFFNAKYTTKYLEDYIDQQSFSGKSMRERTRFGFEVQKIKKVDGKWVITGKNSKGEMETLHSSKMIVASGVTSSPVLPNFSGKDTFKGTVIHQEGFGSSSVLSSADIKNITVLGGSKSGADMVYASVKAGKKVSWVIRFSGTGPGCFVSPKGVGPYKNAFSLGSTRFVATMSPSILCPDTWWTRFLHKSNFGNKLVSGLWNGIDKQVRELGNFEGRESVKGFEKLIPQNSLFWQNGTGGLLNREDFWDTIAPSVQVYRDDILELDNEVVRLKGGEEIPTDALLCGTGWTPSLEFFDRGTLIELGLPHNLEDDPADEATTWARLDAEADKKVIKRFPILANPPEHFEKTIHATPYRLYQGIAPLKDDTIAFVGHVLVANYFRATECQAIWATAFLDKKLKLPSLEERKAEIALLTTWCRRRYLSNGQWGNYIVFDMESYDDKILAQVGLSSHLRGWFKHYFAPGDSLDYAGLWKEYVAKFGEDKSGLNVQSQVAVTADNPIK